MATAALRKSRVRWPSHGRAAAPRRADVIHSRARSAAVFPAARSVITAFSKDSAELKSQATRDLLEQLSEYYSLKESRL